MILKRAPFRYLKPFQEYTALNVRIRTLLGLELDGEGLPTTESLQGAYDRWLAAVTEMVPQGRLLVFPPTAGYGPLCDFLGVATPADDYPHVNDSEDLLGQIIVLKRIADWWPFTCGVLALMAMQLLRLCGRRPRPHLGPSGSDKKND